MTEDEARHWIRDQFGVSRETAIASFVDLVVTESAQQNLVSRTSLESIWFRHVVDSAQLLGLLSGPSAGKAAASNGLWVDIGTGAGFPGMIVALLTDRPVMLVEPRRKRADFLATAAEHLYLGRRVDVQCRRVEQVVGAAAVISARAVAALPELLAAAYHLNRKETIWLLPKGVNALEEVEAARRTWHGSFHVEQSITQPGSLVVIAMGVLRR